MYEISDPAMSSRMRYIEMVEVGGHFFRFGGFHCFAAPRLVLLEMRNGWDIEKRVILGSPLAVPFILEMSFMV